MAGQAQTGVIGQCTQTGQRGQVGPRRIELGGLGKHLGVVGFAGLSIFKGGLHHAQPERLAGHQHVRRAHIGVSLNLLRVNQADCN